MRGRKRRALARVVGLLCLALAFLIFHVTQTRTGRDAVLSLIQGQLEGLVHGQVRLGPVLRGNLLTRVVLERFEIRGPDGQAFIALDSVRLEYDPLGFLRGDFRFRALDAARARVRLAQARDGTWNFERIFGGTPPAPAEEPVVADTSAAREGTRLSFADARVRDGEIEIRTPWEPAPGGPGAETEAAESIWNLEPVGEGEWDQVYRLSSASGTFPLIRILDPRRPFRVEMLEVSGTLTAVRQPLEVRRFDGAATFGDTVRVDLDRMVTAASSLSGAGWVVPGDPLAYAFDLEAPRASFEDLQWLPVPVPSSGGGPMRIDLRSRGETVVVEVSDGDVRSEDTRVRGGFTLALEEPPRFESFDLRLDPMRIRWLDRLLDRPGTIDGYVRGPVSGAGPIDRLRIDADLTLSDLEGGTDPSRVVARGGVALVEPYPLRDLSLELDELEPRWVEVLGFSSGLDGRVSGTATVHRPPGEPFSFEGDVRHRGPDGRTSRVHGSGALDLEAGRTVVLDIVADPLELSAIRPFAPDLELVGSVRGPIRASGGLADLQASADLETPRGRLRFDGRFDLEADEPRYDAEVAASGIELDQWLERAPTSRLAVRGRVVGQGTDPATLQATLDLELLPSELDRARIDTSVVHAELAEGVARVDTLDIRTDIGTVGGQGRFGLVEGREEALAIEARIPDLSALDRWVLEEIPGGAAVEGDEQDLFADFEAAIAAPETRVDGLAGHLVARGVLFGNVKRFSVEAFLDASDPRYQRFGADTLSARVNVRPPDLDSVVAQVTLVGLDLGGQPVDSVSARLERSGEGPAAVRLHARRDTALELAAEGRVEWGEGAYAVDLARLRLQVAGAEAALSEPSRIVYGDSGLLVEEFLLVGELGTFAGNGAVPAGRPGRLDLRVRDVDLSRISRALPEPPELGGRVTGSLSVTGTMDEPRMSGELSILEPTLRAARYEALEGTFEYADRTVRTDIALSGDAGRLARIEGTIRADLSLRPVERRLLEEPLDLRVSADSLPLALLELRVTSLEEIDGYARGSITLQGEPGELRYGGSMRIAGGSAWVPDLGVRFFDAAGEATFRGSEAVIDSLRVASELGGTLGLAGTVDVSSLSDPAFDLELRARRLRPIDRRDMRVAVDGQGRLGGRYRAPELTGEFRILEGDIRQEEFLRARQVVDLTDPTIYALLDTVFVQDRLLERFQNPFMRNLRVDATVDLGPNLWLRSDVLNVEMVATDLSVEMDRARERTVVVGTVELPRGTYRFDRVRPYSQQLRITGGEIQFVGNPDLNPNLSITAEYRTRTPEGPVVVTVHIGGTMDEPQLALSSNPPMSDSDQVCFLAVGAPCVGAADERLGERLVQESILGTLSTGLSSALVGSTGLSYFSLTTYGGAPSGAAGVQGSQGLFSGTAIELGWYAGQDVFLSLSQPLGGGIPRAAVEWRFTQNWTLEARAESRFDQQQYGLFRGTNIENDQTFGLFLFREWSF